MHLPLPLHLTHRTEEQLKASLTQTLSGRSGGVWLFVYGLLAHGPPFAFTDKKTVTLSGHQRRFHLADPKNRGTPQSPGLTIGLAPGGTCTGFAYLLPEDTLHEGLFKVWQQEVLLPFYTPTWLKADGLDILTMLTDPASPALVDEAPEAEVAALISRSSGEAGSNHEYLANVRKAFAQEGVHDTYLDEVAKHLG